jgi:hypothetical protein
MMLRQKSGNDKKSDSDFAYKDLTERHVLFSSQHNIQNLKM